MTYSDEAPMVTNAPEPIPEPGYGNSIMIIIYAFAMIGAAMTGFWLSKAAGDVARAAGWI